MNTRDQYLQYKAVERFLDSLFLAKPIPHFVAAKHESPQHPFGVERVLSFLAALHNPQRRNRYIHIAGTSGKTSTTYLTAALLQAQGYRTARFISPHLTTFAEYFTINDRLPQLDKLIALVERVKPLIDREYEQQGRGMISYAELMVALACAFFAERSVDYVVLEAFLGGRYDATNVIEKPEVSVLTNIGLDHTHILGTTVQEIAQHKVGIMKNGCPFLTGEQRPELLAMFRREAIERQTTVDALGQDFTVEHIRTTQRETVFYYVSPSNVYRKLHVALPGAYQANNAALALRAVEIVSQKRQEALNEEAVRYALRTVRIPGRFEIVQQEPLVILDAAHNPDKMNAFTEALKQGYSRSGVIFVCAFTSGREPQRMFRAMLEVSRTFYLTRAIIGFREDEEPLYLKNALHELEPDAQAHIALDPFRALELALHEARRRQKIVCVTGSVYLIGYLRQRWFPETSALTLKRSS
jgi:dihydrofolate synthase/folylpolyglutamate synthase